MTNRYRAKTGECHYCGSRVEHHVACERPRCRPVDENAVGREVAAAVESFKRKLASMAAERGRK